MSERVKRFGPWVLIATLLFAVVAVRVFVEGARELAAGDAAEARHDDADAIRHWRRAAHWYAPGSPACAHAYERLEAMATRAETQGRSEVAFSAWRSIRASALATRWLVVPEHARLERANRHIATILASMPQPPEDRGRETTRIREEHLARLNQDRAPEPAWIVMMAIGFAMWLGAAFHAARHGWDEQERPRRRVLATSAVVLVAGIALFLLSVAKA